MRITRDDDYTVSVHLEDDFNFESGMACTAEILKVVEKPSQIRFVFDGVRNIDSSGIGALIALRDQIPRGSPTIQLVNPPQHITKVLENCRLNQFFNILCLV